MPLMTLKKVMRPAKGSVMVLKTTMPVGSLSTTLRIVVLSSESAGAFRSFTV